ncbi:hypothetical protein BO70DRAFT_427637 [Aspergillus heteromorphus CBS 117.55]|uniref:Rhodopsin domain-containing protein n=1 Tax=Aspergillus heteromorphus CBS 117.55 TaxID=1448321 RepID=A0A317WMK4_9EURO|nr:uncharacterized protein BO70DRAFT_427637 [Aspergillus heteromorphus CBS 117.55]PWY87736.1 hypothetical protein BO70DRAFT_427637 [Aspergillus heteromorphus CBS 117.55]
MDITPPSRPMLWVVVFASIFLSSSATTMSPDIPPGQSAPFQVVDDLHHGAWIIINGAMGLVLSLASFFIRLYVRLALHPPFAYDDYVLLGARTVAIIQSALLFDATSLGLGTSTHLLQPTNNQLTQIQTLTTIGDILFLTTLYISKCCVLGIYLRLTPRKPHNRASQATLALCTACLIAAVLVVAVNCELNRPWEGFGAQCVDLLQRWRFIVALDIVTELILFGLAVALLWGLFMSVGRKLMIGFAFVFRLPLIIFSILHIITIQQNIHDPDPTLAVVGPIIWAQVELNYALVACSVFCLRPFMAAVSTNYGTAGDSNLEGSGGARSLKIRGGLSSKEGSGGRSLAGAGARDGRREGRNGVAGRSIELELDLVERGGRDSVGSEGGSAKKMVIRKDVEYSIEYNGESSNAGGQGMDYWV